MSSKGTVRKLNGLMERRCSERKKGGRLKYLTPPGIGGIAALFDTSPTSNPKRPPLLLTLVAGALSGAGIVFPDKSYVSAEPYASSTSYGSANTAKKRNRKRWKVWN
jgi:hypothetical protein